MSGNLEPDAAGTYESSAPIDGYPAWYSAESTHYIRYEPGIQRWILYPNDEAYAELGIPHWMASESPDTPAKGNYSPLAGATGTATVS